MVLETAVFHPCRHLDFPDGKDEFFSAYIPDISQLKAGENVCQDSSTLIYNRPAWVGGSWRQVQCRFTSPDYHLHAESSSHFLVRGGGKAIERVSRNGKPRKINQVDWDLLHGPLLVLALAMQGIWCMHASSVALNGQCSVFLGDSGGGKSTLATYLVGQSAPAWQLISDDILPVFRVEDKLVAQPVFPQMKLPLRAQIAIRLPTNLAVERIFVLQPAEETARADVKKLTPRQAAQELLRHTAGARLFAPDLLGRHLDFCGQMAGRVPVYRLKYPHTADALGQVKNLLEQT